MKRLLSLFLCLLLIFPLTTAFFTVAAETSELLENPGFESGTKDGFFNYGGSAKVQFSKAYAHTGAYGMRVYSRTHKYDCIAQDITKTVVLCGPGTYKASAWVRVPGGVSASAMLVLNYRLSGDSGDRYVTSGGMQQLGTEWIKLSFEKEILYDAADFLDHAYLYVQSYDASNQATEIWIDDFSLKKTSDVNGEDPALYAPISTANDQRSLYTTIGAIRWDAWYTHDGQYNSVISQVEASLGPAHYHFRAPFFASITGENSLIIPNFDQAVFDREMLYAMEAGIDYFAYVWYSGSMSAARVCHTKSKYRNQVKMCTCFDGNAIGKDYARNEMKTLLLQDYYMKVLDGRPLMYYFASSSNLDAVKTDILYYRKLCKELQIPMPYAVVMNVSAADAQKAMGDAVSSYAIGAYNGATYATLMQSCKNNWETWRKSGMDFVPTVSLGWHALPRYEHPVTWTTVGANSYAQYATDAEIGTQIANALTYMKQENVKKQTKPNTVIVYAWNEHDEGGWLCPTLQVDANGHQLYAPDGSKLINDGRVKSFAASVENTRRVKIGDTNGDEAINAADLTLVAGQVARMPVVLDRYTADVTRNGSITSDDVTCLARHLAGIEFL